LENLTLGAVARNPGGFAALAAAGRVLAVQAQVAPLFVRPVTFVAALDEDRLDVAAEINFGLVGGKTPTARQRTCETEPE
jgi:hypothetical protein